MWSRQYFSFWLCACFSKPPYFSDLVVWGPVLLERVWKRAHRSSVSLKSWAQTHWGCINWQSYIHGASNIAMVQHVQPDAYGALLLHSSRARQNPALLGGRGKIQSWAGTSFSYSCVVQDTLLHSNAKMNLLYQCQHRVLQQNWEQTHTEKFWWKRCDLFFPAPLLSLCVTIDVPGVV